MVPKNLSGFSWFFPPCFFKNIYNSFCPLENGTRKKKGGSCRRNLSKNTYQTYGKNSS